MAVPVATSPADIEKIALLMHADQGDAHRLFVEDVIADPNIAPQLQDAHRTPGIRVIVTGTFPDFPPDIRTPHTDAYIVSWEEKRQVAKG